MYQTVTMLPITLEQYVNFLKDGDKEVCIIKAQYKISYWLVSNIEVVDSINIETNNSQVKGQHNNCAVIDDPKSAGIIGGPSDEQLDKLSKLIEEFNCKTTYWCKSILTNSSIDDLKTASVSEPGDKLKESVEDSTNTNYCESGETKYNNTILDEASSIVNGNRQEAYGNQYQSYRRIGDLWGALLNTHFTIKEVGLMLVLLKVSREQSNHSTDNLIDIAGYAEVTQRALLQEAERFCLEEGEMYPDEESEIEKRAREFNKNREFDKNV